MYSSVSPDCLTDGPDTLLFDDVTPTPSAALPYACSSGSDGECCEGEDGAPCRPPSLAPPSAPICIPFTVCNKRQNSRRRRLRPQRLLRPLDLLGHPSSPAAPPRSIAAPRLPYSTPPYPGDTDEGVYVASPASSDAFSISSDLCASSHDDLCYLADTRFSLSAPHFLDGTFRRLIADLTPFRVHRLPYPWRSRPPPSSTPPPPPPPPLCSRSKGTKRIRRRCPPSQRHSKPARSPSSNAAFSSYRHRFDDPSMTPVKQRVDGSPVCSAGDDLSIQNHSLEDSSQYSHTSTADYRPAEYLSTVTTTVTTTTITSPGALDVCSPSSRFTTSASDSALDLAVSPRRRSPRQHLRNRRVPPTTPRTRRASGGGGASLPARGATSPEAGLCDAGCVKSRRESTTTPTPPSPPSPQSLDFIPSQRRRQCRQNTLPTDSSSSTTSSIAVIDSEHNRDEPYSGLVSPTPPRSSQAEPGCDVPSSSTSTECPASPGTDLFECSAKGEISAIKTMVLQDVDAVHNVDQSGCNALFYACYFGQIRSLQLLINIGLNVNHLNKQGQTPLMIACLCDDLDLSKLLLDNGAAVDSQDVYGFTALMYACDRNNPRLIKKLLQYGAPVSTENINGCQCFEIQSRLSNMSHFALTDHVRDILQWR